MLTLSHWKKLFRPQPGCDNFSSHLLDKQEKFIGVCQQHITTLLVKTTPFIDLWNKLPAFIQKTLLRSLIDKKVYFILPGARIDIHVLLPEVLSRLGRSRSKDCQEPTLIDYLKTEIRQGKMFIRYLRAMPNDTRYNFVEQAYNRDIPWSIADILTLMKLAPWENYRTRFLAALLKEIKTVSDLIEVHAALETTLEWSSLFKQVPLADIILTTGHLTALLKHCGNTHFAEAIENVGSARIDAIFYDWVQLVEVMEHLEPPLRVKLLMHLSPERLRRLSRECALLGVLFQLLPGENHHFLLDKLGDNHLQEVTKDNQALAHLTLEITPEQRLILFYKLGAERIHAFIQNGQHLSEALAILPPEHRECLLHLLGRERLRLIIQGGKQLQQVLTQFEPEKRGPLCLVWADAFVETGECIGIVLQQVPQAQWSDLQQTITEAQLKTAIYDKTQLTPIFAPFTTREDVGAVLDFLGLSVVENAIDHGGDFYDALGNEHFALAIAHIPANKLCEWFSKQKMQQANKERIFVPAMMLALVEAEIIFYKFINYLVNKLKLADDVTRYNERIIDFATILNFIEDHLDSAELQTELAALLPTLKTPSTRSPVLFGLGKSQENYQKLRSELSTIPTDSLRHRYLKLKSMLTAAVDNPLPDGANRKISPQRHVLMQLEISCRRLRASNQSATSASTSFNLRKSGASQLVY